ncbi:putative Oxidoreductase-like domain-containing protein [Helianthus anomalus]
MADSGSNNKIKSYDGSIIVKDATETKKPPEIPPPLEKSLPGDCCGSSCVRRIWDVYYDELEEYSKIRKGGSDSTAGGFVGMAAVSWEEEGEALTGISPYGNKKISNRL